MPAHGKKPVTVTDLENAADKLRKQAAILLQLRDVLRSKGTKTVDAMGWPMVVRADRSVANFIRSIKRELDLL